MAKNLEISVLFDFYGDLLTEKQAEMIDLYYNDDLSLGEISEIQGVTRQGVRDSIKRAENQMFELEEKLSMVKRFREIQRGLEHICSLAARIGELNGETDSEIDECVEDIIDTAKELYD